MRTGSQLYEDMDSSELTVRQGEREEEEGRGEKRILLTCWEGGSEEVVIEGGSEVSELTLQCMCTRIISIGQ